MLSRLLPLILMLNLSSAARAEQSRQSNTQLMVAGSSALTAMTLQSLMKANSFRFTFAHGVDDLALARVRDLSSIVSKRRYGALALRSANQITMELSFTTPLQVRDYKLWSMQQHALDLTMQAEKTWSASKKAQLISLARDVKSARDRLARLSSQEVIERYRGKALTPTHTLKSSQLSKLNAVANQVTSVNGGKINAIRVLTVFHNQKIAQAMRYGRNGTVAVAVIAGLGLLKVEESASALEAARRNRELAAMMQKQ